MLTSDLIANPWPLTRDLDDMAESLALSLGGAWVAGRPGGFPHR